MRRILDFAERCGSGEIFRGVLLKEYGNDNGVSRAQ